MYRGERDQIAVAQDVLDRHVTSSATGRCLECGAPGPCWRRETAVVVFSRFLRLPRRVPGSSRPELIGSRRVNAGLGERLATGAGCCSVSGDP
jgi:hypothetical protein